MWTLTLDPTLFASPAEAYAYCRSEKVISKLIRVLRRKGVLNSKHYFVAIEFQKTTKMVHFHLLVRAKFVPFQMVADAWNKNRPKDAPPVVGDRPAFGSVRFSVPKFADASHAINYATKYVIKTPEEGWPEWVMDSKLNISRYQSSRGFFTDHDCHQDPPASPSLGEPESAVADAEAADMEKFTQAEWDEKLDAERRTVRERIAACRQKAVVMQVTEMIYPDGEVKTFQRYLGECAEEYAVYTAGFVVRPFSFEVPVASVSGFLGKRPIMDDEYETIWKARRESDGSLCATDEGEARADGRSASDRGRSGNEVFQQ